MTKIGAVEGDDNIRLKTVSEVEWLMYLMFQSLVCHSKGNSLALENRVPDKHYLAG